MLRFCFGPSGVGKSRMLLEEAIRESMAAPGKQFLIVVPDQYTLQVQRDVVSLHPRHAISDIDVLSFSRLAHRIFDEVGGPEVPVLDDMGKTLVLKLVAARIRERLPLLGPRMHLPGFIDEVKSLFSEFLQYRISPDDLDGMISACSLQGALAARLGDIKTLYVAFGEYINGHYVTAEETMGILAKKIHESDLLRGSVVLFDGFTGFTPIQYQVLLSILQVAERMTVSLVADPSTNPHDRTKKETDLFGLTVRTVAALEDLAAQADIKITDDIFLRGRPVIRLKENPPLAFLEEHLFRDETVTFAEDPGEHLSLSEAADPFGECEQCCLAMRRRLRDDPSLKYGDMAVLCTDPETYMPLMERAGALFGIPFYLDRTDKVQMNPLVECVESALGVLSERYSAASVFRFLRCPLSGFLPEEVDRLQLYAEALGIRGKKRWHEPFIRVAGKGRTPEETAARLDEANRLRERFAGLMDLLHDAKARDIRGISTALVSLFDALNVQDALVHLAKEREAAGDEPGKRACEQIYAKVIGLMDQMVLLLGEQEIGIRDYGELLQTGLNKITIGMIPGGIDRVIVGDLERTRLGEKKIVFLLGVNDTLLPKSSSGGGLLGELDRRFLNEALPQVELAPDGPAKLLDEREYLYLSLTKPSRSICLFWSLVGTDGKSLRPATLIRRIRGLFPSLMPDQTREQPLISQLETAQNARAYVAAHIRDYAEGQPVPGGDNAFLTLFHTLRTEGPEKEYLSLLAEQAFYQYRPKTLSKETGEALYGSAPEGSVRRLELFAACPFAHFADYGLKLKEQDRYEVNPAHLGTIYHGVLEGFGGMLTDAGLNWKNFTEKEEDAFLRELLDAQALQVQNGILLSNDRYLFMQRRLRRILGQTVRTIRYQLEQGEMDPFLSEWSFHESAPGILLRGRVDRADLCAQEGKRYLRVIDFKSGAHAFEPALFYRGMQLQLMLYLSAVVHEQKKRYPDETVIPAGVFYYHMQDPILSLKENSITSDIERKRRKLLSLKGVANSDPLTLRLMDRNLQPGVSSSDILPVGIKKDGALTAHSTAASTEAFEKAFTHAQKTIALAGERIRAGAVEIAPYRYRKENSCTYCEYRGVCGFDRKIPGFALRDIPPMGLTEMFERISK